MKRIIGCDLFLNLKLYCVPADEIKKIEIEFPEFKIVPVNVENHSIYNESIEIYWGNRINPNIIQNSPNLKWIHFGSLGVNNARCKEVIDRNILVTNSRGTVERSVAISAFSLFLSLARGLKKGIEISLDGSFSRSSFEPYFDRMLDLDDNNALIVGYGEIGKFLAYFLKSMGIKIKAIVKNPSGRQDSAIDSFHSLNELKNLVQETDVIFNLLPYTEETKQIFNKDVFIKIKEKSFFINVGRGETVEENSLIEFLKNGRIGGAGLDVFENEPLVNDSPLHKIDNVILTPHISAISPNYWKNEIALFKKNLNLYIQSKMLANKIDLSKGY